MKQNFVLYRISHLKCSVSVQEVEDFRAFGLEIFKLGVPNLFYKYNIIILRSPRLPSSLLSFS